MTDTIDTSNSVIIREEERYCRSPQFSLNYPKQLTGIIDPDDFRQSIVNINRAARPTHCQQIVKLSLYLCSLIGLVIFIAGVTLIWVPIASLWITLMSSGFTVFLCFFVIAIFVSSRIYRACDMQLDRAIDLEAKKYATKTSVPTRWRLDMTIFTRRLSSGPPRDIQYYLLIEIGSRSTLEIPKETSNAPTDTVKPTSYISQRPRTYSLLHPKSWIHSSSEKALHKKHEARIHSLT